MLSNQDQIQSNRIYIHLVALQDFITLMRKSYNKSLIICKLQMTAIDCQKSKVKNNADSTISIFHYMMIQHLLTPSNKKSNSNRVF